MLIGRAGPWVSGAGGTAIGLAATRDCYNGEENPNPETYDEYIHWGWATD
ncbi:hypothetical protein GCM10010530_44760 [Kribbella aluminosa]